MSKHESFLAAEIRTATITVFPWKRKNLFARMLDALQHSRRVQAQRIVRQYRDLILHGDQPRFGLSRPSRSLCDHPTILSRRDRAHRPTV